MIRTILSRKLKGCPQVVELLADIDLARLRLAGIAGIILDLDNTIVSEDDRWLSPDAYSWIEQAKRHGFKLFLLSNGKRRDRVKYWSKHLGILAISPARKPLPSAFHQALQSMKLNPNRVVVIGDSFHTDVVGAWLSRCAVIQVASLPHPTRVWEKYIGPMVHMSYPRHRPLLPFDRQTLEQQFSSRQASDRPASNQQISNQQISNRPTPNQQDPQSYQSIV